MISVSIVKKDAIKPMRGHTRAFYASFIINGEKYCPVCKRGRTFEHFSKNNRSKSGYECYCKDCQAIRRTGSLDVRTKSLTRIELAKSKKRICRTCKSIKSFDDFYKDKNRKYGVRSSCINCDHIERISPRIANRSKNNALKLAYGITLKEYNTLLIDQNGVCAICENTEVVIKHGSIQRLAVDHCHTTGEVRGLLCQNCNTGIGLFKENKDFLLKSIKYLDKSLK